MSVKINFSKNKPKETTMGTIKVKTVEGRVAFDAPRGGKKIPADQFVSVRETTYIRRLIDHHGDLIEEGKTAAPGTPTHQPATAQPAAPSAPAAPVAKPTT